MWPSSLFFMVLGFLVSAVNSTEVIRLIREKASDSELPFCMVCGYIWGPLIN